MMGDHPARFSRRLFPIFAECVDAFPRNVHRRRPLRVLDPFAGTGGIHELQQYTTRSITTVGVEIEPEGHEAHLFTIVGDATALPARWTGRFDIVLTSPCYGNRMADAHDARDLCSVCGGHAPQLVTCTKCKGTGLSPRRNYRNWIGRPPASNSAGAMQWGEQYRALHEAAWREARRVLVPGGWLVLNIKDHVRDHAVVHVARWHDRTIQRLGFTPEWCWTVPLHGYRNGENSQARVDNELVYVYSKPKGTPS